MAVVLWIFGANGRGQKAERVALYIYLCYDNLFAVDDISFVVKAADISYAAGNDRVHPFIGVCKEIFCEVDNFDIINYCCGDNCSFENVVPEVENQYHRIEDVPGGS